MFCSVFFVIAPTKSIAQTQNVNFISQNIPKLNQTTTDLSQNVLVLLTLIKEYEQSQPLTNFKIVRITKPVSHIKETDNINSLTIVEARLNEEFVITDEHDKWYKIKTNDNREGWLPVDDIQVLTKQQNNPDGNVRQIPKRETGDLVSQIVRFKNKIDELYQTAGMHFKEAERRYNELSDKEKQSLKTDYQLLSAYKEKIEKYHNYAVRYFQPYSKFLTESVTSGLVITAPGEKFKGTISADIGRSTYNNVTSSSTTSRRLSFDGLYQIDKATSLNVSANHQNELVQSAFTNSTIEAGITHQFADKFALGANFGYNNYNDKTLDSNSFGLSHVQMNALFTPTSKIRFFGNVNLQSKKFNASSENDYHGLSFVFGTNLTQGSSNILKFQVSGNNQISQKNFLEFNQLMPQFSYTVKKSAERTLVIGFDYDLLEFVQAKSPGDYQKYRFNFLSRNNTTKKGISKKLDLTYKKYPNNEKQDFLRIGYTYETREGSSSDKKSSVSSISYLLTLVTKRDNNFLTDYLDIRWDRSGTRPGSYSNSNVCMKFWNNFDKMLNDTLLLPEHLMDFYTEFGPYLRNNSDADVKITDLKAGLILGGHLYFRFNSNAFISNGNSARCGLAVNSNIKVYKANLSIGGSYELSFILCKVADFNSTSGNIKYGKNLLRKPSSIQINIDYRQPISKSWDLHFNFNTYDIRTDATTETSINPVEKKSNLRVTGGLIYRFAI